MGAKDIGLKLFQCPWPPLIAPGPFFFSKIRRKESGMRKRCSKCRKIQGFKSFSKNSANRDGHDHYCKACNKKRLAAYFMTKEGKAAMKRASFKRYATHRGK